MNIETVNEIEQLAEQHGMTVEFVTWFFNEKKAGCGNVWFMMLAAMWEGWKGRSIEMDKLAAENVGLIRSAECLLHEASEVYRAYNKTQLPDGDLVDGQSLQEVWDAINATPATDRIYAEAEARGVEKLIEHLVNNGYDSVANGVKAYMQLREGAK